MVSGLSTVNERSTVGEVRVWTVGHSTRSLEEFVALLRAHGIELLADVRTIPRSRRNPQFNRETLPVDLQAGGIDYTHLPRLGGRRRGLEIHNDAQAEAVQDVAWAVPCL